MYEEEVFSSDFALWWSPDSSKIAFLVSDETQVNEYAFPIYNPTPDSDTVVPYPAQLTMRYPKPGYPNPLVTAHIFDLGRFLSDGSSGYRRVVNHARFLNIPFANRAFSA